MIFSVTIFCECMFQTLTLDSLADIADMWSRRGTHMPTEKCRKGATEVSQGSQGLLRLSNDPTTPWSQPTSDMCTVVREGAHKFWSFLGSFFGIMTKLMGSWAHSFNSWALLLGRHWTHGLICPKNCKNFKSWALSFLSIHEQKSNAPIRNIFSTAGALVVVTV